MNWSKIVVLSLFTVIITFIAIYLNWSEFLMGNSATTFNLIVSIVFLLLWLIFSFYWGKRKEKKYIKFIFIYWGINIISFLLIWIVSKSNFYTLFLLPFSIWYGSPIYGFRHLLESDISGLILVTAPLGLIICAFGYGIGMLVPKINKS